MVGGFGRQTRYLVCGLLVWTPSVFAIESAPVSPSGEDSRWSIEDNLRIKKLGQGYFEESPFSYSASGKYAAWVTLSSDIASNQNIARLQIFSVSELRAFGDGGPRPKPLLVHEIASGKNEAGIRSLRWSSEDSLLLIADKPSRSALMQWRPGSPLLELFGPPRPIAAFQILDEHDKLVAFSPNPAGGGRSTASENDPFVATGLALADALGLASSVHGFFAPHDLVVGDMRTGSWTIYRVDAVPLYGLSVAPDGSKLLFAQPLDAAWRGRCWQAVGSRSLTPAVQVGILDLRMKAVSLPFRAPLAGSILIGGNVELPIWSPDSSSAIAAHTFTHRDVCTGEERNVSLPGAYEFSSDGSAVELIQTFPLTESGSPESAPFDLRWLNAHRITWTEMQLLGFGFDPVEGDNDAIIYERRTTQWNKSRTEVAPEKPKINPVKSVVELREDYDIAPTLVAVGESGGVAVLEEFAPHAAERTLGKTSIIEWRDVDGTSWTGLLAVPLISPPKKGFPLIIQTHDVLENTFFAEGVGTSAYPGRAALSRGFVVLTINDLRNSRVAREIFVNSQQETELVLKAYRSAIEHLSDSKLIDSSRVGIIGWSRTAYHVKYAITQDPGLFKAAVAVDGLDFGYWQYLASLDHAESSFATQYARLYGGPVWDESRQWLRAAPGFNLGQLSTPIRIEAYSHSSTVTEWEFYAGARRKGVPADLIVFPDGDHSLARPLERKHSTEGSLDWLDYWINHKRNEGSGKAAQYARWDLLCRAWKEGRENEYC